ncbi:MAG: hotdog domain-containing protein, partial [Actinomycetota bacterium]
MELEVGLIGSAQLVVGPDDTAQALGSGDVEVLGTPRVVALCEAATVDALRARLAVGTTTVGTRVQVDHLRPTAVGAEVHAEAVLDSVDGRRLTFTVSATDAGG